VWQLYRVTGVVRRGRKIVPILSHRRFIQRLYGHP